MSTTVPRSALTPDADLNRGPPDRSPEPTTGKPGRSPPLTPEPRTRGQDEPGTRTHRIPPKPSRALACRRHGAFLYIPRHWSGLHFGQGSVGRIRLSALGKGAAPWRHGLVPRLRHRGSRPRSGGVVAGQGIGLSGSGQGRVHGHVEQRAYHVPCQRTGLSFAQGPHSPPPALWQVADTRRNVGTRPARIPVGRDI